MWTPSLLSNDLQATKHFYGQLGFELCGCDKVDGTPTWMELCRGDVRIQFYRDPPAGTVAAPSLSGTLYLTVPDVDVVATKMNNHCEPAWGPEDMSYGGKEVGYQDPNGYYIAFRNEKVA